MDHTCCKGCKLSFDNFDTGLLWAQKNGQTLQTLCVDVNVSGEKE